MQYKTCSAIYIYTHPVYNEVKFALGAPVKIIGLAPAQIVHYIRKWYTHLHVALYKHSVFARITGLVRKRLYVCAQSLLIFFFVSRKQRQNHD